MDQNTLKEKNRHICGWLADLFGEQKVPQYEINERTVTHLYDLMLHNREMDRLARLATEDIVQKTEEYKLEAARLHELLEGIGLPVYVLSNAGKTNLKSLTDLANSLQIKDANKSTYCLAMADLSSQLSEISIKIKDKQKNIEDLKKKSKATNGYLQTLHSFYGKNDEYSAVDIPILEKRKKEMETLSTKSKTYQSQIEEYERGDAVLINGNKHLHHDTLLYISQELEELKKELKPLQRKYTSYRSLPPDVNLAKVKIEEAKLQLAKLEQQLQTDIDLLVL